MSDAKRQKLLEPGDDEDPALRQLRLAAERATAQMAAVFGADSSTGGDVQQAQKFAATPGGQANDLEKAGQGVSEIQLFLTSIGLEQYLQQFVMNGFDTMTAVEAMDEADMRNEIGMELTHIKLLKQRLGSSDDQGKVPHGGTIGGGVPQGGIIGGALPQGGIIGGVIGGITPGTLEAGAVPQGGTIGMPDVQGMAASQAMVPTGQIIGATQAQGVLGLVIGGNHATPAQEKPKLKLVLPGAAPAMQVPAGVLAMRAKEQQEAEGYIHASFCNGSCMGRCNPDGQVASSIPRLGDVVLPQATEAFALTEDMLLAQENQMLATAMGDQDLQGSFSAFHALLGNAAGSEQAASSIAPVVGALTLPGLQGLGSTHIPGPAMLTGGGITTNSPDGTLFALAQLAEEAAQMATSASTFCMTPNDMSQVPSVTEAAEQAHERAKWAAKVVAEMCPPEGSVVDEWLSTVREITETAAQVASKAFNTCKVSAEEVNKLLPEDQKIQKSKVPCRHFKENGFCKEGASCRFSHDARDLAARPVMLKRQEICKFHQQGKCIRGIACAYAHSQEELEEITKYVSELRKEKGQQRRMGQQRR